VTSSIRRSAPDCARQVAGLLSDCECLRGSPFHARIGGLRTPDRSTLGSDIAGRVEAVGAAVTRFRPGDEVYRDNLGLKGGCADYGAGGRF